MSLTQLRDERGFTLLHHAALKSRPDQLRLIYTFAKDEQQEDEDILIDWVNSKSLKERLSPLHLACFKGCLKSVKLLIGYGAQIKSENIHGMGMLHLAA